MSELQSESPENKDENVRSLKSTSDSSAFDGNVLPIDEHVEEVVGEDGCKTPHRGIYLLPNLFTTAALFSGFYAIIAGTNGNFEYAAIAIFIAMILDGLDGRVARLTNTTSAFGEQYDSLSDMVSFGLAPALVIFSWALHDLGTFGWVCAFVYAVCAALRLARFNTQIGSVDSRYCIGLASPAAAAIVAGIVWVGSDVSMSFELSVFAAIMTVFAGLLMVSNFNYSSFKGLDFKSRVPFVSILAVVLILAVLAIDTPKMLLTIFACYGLSGPVLWLWQKFGRKG
jgi:CDP-diacylglycerol--serine O-phosphatidyltransferase